MRARFISFLSECCVLALEFFVSRMFTISWKVNCKVHRQYVIYSSVEMEFLTSFSFCADLIAFLLLHSLFLKWQQLGCTNDLQTKSRERNKIDREQILFVFVRWKAIRVKSVAGIKLTCYAIELELKLRVIWENLIID